MSLSITDYSMFLHAKLGSHGFQAVIKSILTIINCHPNPGVPHQRRWGHARSGDCARRCRHTRPNNRRPTSDHGNYCNHDDDDDNVEDDRVEDDNVEDGPQASEKGRTQVRLRPQDKETTSTEPSDYDVFKWMSTIQMWSIQMLELWINEYDLLRWWRNTGERHD